MQTPLISNNTTLKKQHLSYKDNAPKCDYTTRDQTYSRKTNAQIHLGNIHLLPALPTEWKEGKITGLKARGGFLVNMEWQDGKLRTATIRSEYPAEATVVYKDERRVLSWRAGEEKLLTFN